MSEQAIKSFQIKLFVGIYVNGTLPHRTPSFFELKGKLSWSRDDQIVMEPITAILERLPDSSPLLATGALVSIH